ncbi:MAG: HAD family phosphatase [Lachnospiraceae bacterium]|nr:HAD family phosphatase [Lachnospiraceae bacterium]
MFDKTKLDDIDAVIFDLDGTLVDSMGIWHEIDIEYLGERGIDMPHDLQQSIEGMSFYETAVYFKETFKLTDTLEVIMNTWNQMALDKYKTVLTLKENVKDFLQILVEKGIKIGIATSNSRILTESFLEVNDVSQYFSAIATGTEIKKGKPEPDVYLWVADKLGVMPERCLVFEDLPFGIIAGKRAGMATCAVEDTYSAELRDEKIRLADYYITSYKEVI